MNTDIKEFDYIFCLPGKNFSNNFLISWSNTLIYLMQNRINFLYCNFYSSLVQYTRNSLIRNYPGNYQDLSTSAVLPFDGKVKCKKIIFIDDDMVWTVSDIEKIIKSDKDIISGFYKMNFNAPEGVLAATKNNKYLSDKDVLNQTELIELSGIGFGFVAIKQDVFNNIKFPWFAVEETINENTGIVSVLTEDFYFCNKAINFGYKIYGDPTIQLGHEKNKTLKIGTYHE